MFRCSLYRLRPRRRILPPSSIYRASPYASFATSSAFRVNDDQLPDDHVASSSPGSVGLNPRPWKPAVQPAGACLGVHFVAPSARGITPGVNLKGSFLPFDRISNSDQHCADDPHALLVRAGYVRQVLKSMSLTIYTRLTIDQGPCWRISPASIGPESTETC